MRLGLDRSRRVTTKELARRASKPNAVYIGDNRVVTKVDVNGKGFVFHCEANDKLITPWFITTGRYDDNSTAFILNTVKRDFHCIDVGANFGYFTCLLARCCPDGRVIGIEADAAIASLARDNLLMNGLHEIAEIRHAAANASGAAMHLYRRVGRSGNTSMIVLASDFTDFMNEPAAEPFDVAGVRIDDLLPSLGGRLDFLKIDVEGAEPLVFDGALSAIAANEGLTILLEWSPGQMVAAGFEVRTFASKIEATGLLPFVLGKRGPEPVTYDALIEMPYQSGIVLSRRIGWR